MQHYGLRTKLTETKDESDNKSKPEIVHTGSHQSGTQSDLIRYPRRLWMSRLLASTCHALYCPCWRLSSYSSRQCNPPDGVVAPSTAIPSQRTKSRMTVKKRNYCPAVTVAAAMTRTTRLHTIKMLDATRLLLICDT